jgi:predicted ATP-grasp superfamily ATP-dependent carboligase
MHPGSVLIAGVSTRAAAESAARAGFTVTAIDAFGDLDQHPAVRSISLGPHFTANRAVHAAEGVTCDAVVYLSNFENHPKAISALAEGRSLWGNPPQIVRRVRDPRIVSGALRSRGLAGAEVRLEPGTATESLGKRWLAKPLASGGGQRIRPWEPDIPPPHGCYLQEFIDGPSGSVVFVAAGGRIAPLGVSHQLVGQREFGSAGFQYCGNVLSPAGDELQSDALVGAACSLAEAVADEFQLVGLNGVDFITRDGMPHALEVNPRWCASIELVERAYGVSAFSAHLDACVRLTLPAFDLLRARRGASATGKAVVYARSDTTVGDTREWLAEPDHIRDIPRPGEQIPAGRPVCTVFATGRTATACRDALVNRAERVYAQLEAWNQGQPRIG